MAKKQAHRFGIRPSCAFWLLEPREEISPRIRGEKRLWCSWLFVDSASYDLLLFLSMFFNCFRSDLIPMFIAVIVHTVCWTFDCQGGQGWKKKEYTKKKQYEKKKQYTKIREKKTYTKKDLNGRPIIFYFNLGQCFCIFYSICVYVRTVILFLKFFFTLTGRANLPKWRSPFGRRAYRPTRPHPHFIVIIIKKTIMFTDFKPRFIETS